MIPAKYWKLPYYLHLPRVPTAPLYVNVEPTNACNLRCSICSMDASRPRGLLSTELFQRIVDQCVEAQVPHISLFLSGEPTIHPKLPELVAIAERAGIETGIHTNATKLDEAKSRALIEAGLSQISFSLDGEDKRTYESIRIGARWEQVLSNVTRFLQIKQQYGTGKPWVTIQVIKLFRPEMSGPDGRTRYPEVAPEFRRRFIDLPVDEWKVVLPHNWAGEMPTIASKPPGAIYYPCHHLWMGLSIAWDGRVLGCCTDLNGRYERGNVYDSTIKEIWNDRRTQYLRRMQAQGRFRELELCRDCDQVWQEEHPIRADLRALPVLQPVRALYRRLRPTTVVPDQATPDVTTAEQSERKRRARAS